MKYSIKEVSTRKELKNFVKFPNKLYKDNKFYVPQLESADLDALTKEKNHAFEYCDAKYWLAYDENGKIVGRIAGIINHQYNKKTGTNYARFGWVDFIDDKEVVKLLFDTAEKWAKDNGMQQICGPVGFLEFDASGVLVEGFDELPTAYGKYNHPYYEPRILELGFTKEIDWVEYRITTPCPIPEKYYRIAQIVEKRENLRVATIKNKRELKKYIGGVFDLINKVYDKLHGYSQLSQGQIDDLIAQFVPQLNLDFVSIILNSDDKIVGFGVCLPSMSKALQKAKGKLFPFGFIHILRALKKNDTIDTLLIGIDPDYQQKGVNALIFREIAKGIEKYNIKYVESTRELEDNFSVQNLWNKFDHRLHKRARSYIKEIK